VNKERYTRVKQLIVTIIGISVAFGVLSQSWVIPLVTITLGFVVLYVSNRQVTEILHDERTIAIQQKAASRTLGYVTAFTGFMGIALVELSFYGFSELRNVGYALAYQANIVLGVYAFFTWYYQKQMSG
jgi:uncharacterized membrane protein